MRSLWLVIMATCCTPLLATVPADRTCDQCACPGHCRKVCRVICEMVETTRVTYDCKCEDICIPGPSKRCGTECVPDGRGGHIRKHKFIPSCGTVKSVKKLVKKEEVVKTPKYKWVVEYLCPSCTSSETQCTSTETQDDTGGWAACAPAPQDAVAARSGAPPGDASEAPDPR
jgi:hypothetical protein